MPFASEPNSLNTSSELELTASLSIYCKKETKPYHNMKLINFRELFEYAKINSYINEPF